jgi:hypothetical protein
MDPSIRLSLHRLAEKVGWEGGIMAALDYGIRSGNIDDEEVARLWADLEALHDRMEPLMDQIDRRLSRARAA